MADKIGAFVQFQDSCHPLEFLDFALIVWFLNLTLLFVTEINQV